MIGKGGTYQNFVLVISVSTSDRARRLQSPRRLEINADCLPVEMPPTTDGRTHARMAVCNFAGPIR